VRLGDSAPCLSRQGRIEPHRDARPIIAEVDL